MSSHIISRSFATLAGTVPSPVLCCVREFDQVCTCDKCLGVNVCVCAHMCEMKQVCAVQTTTSKYDRKSSWTAAEFRISEGDNDEGR